MDPTAALTTALSAMIDMEARRNSTDDPTKEDLDVDAENREEAIDNLLNLVGWLKRGGFPPDVEAAIEPFLTD